MAEPMKMRQNSMNCCQVLSSLRLTVFKPLIPKLVTGQVEHDTHANVRKDGRENTHASVIALTQRKSESVKGTGVVVEEAQNMTAARRHVKMK